MSSNIIKLFHSIMPTIYSVCMILSGSVVCYNSVDFSTEWCLGTIMIFMAMFMNILAQK